MLLALLASLLGLARGNIFSTFYGNSNNYGLGGLSNFGATSKYVLPHTYGSSIGSSANVYGGSALSSSVYGDYPNFTPAPPSYADYARSFKEYGSFGSNNQDLFSSLASGSGYGGASHDYGFGFGGNSGHSTLGANSYSSGGQTNSLQAQIQAATNLLKALQSTSNALQASKSSGSEKSLFGGGFGGGFGGFGGFGGGFGGFGGFGGNSHGGGYGHQKVPGYQVQVSHEHDDEHGYGSHVDVVLSKHKKPKKIITINHGMFIPNGVQMHGKFKSLKDCEEACGISPQCFAGDYDPWSKKCYAHSNNTACQPQSTHPSIIHFKKVVCSLPETSRGRITLGTQIFRGIEQKHISDLKTCIKKCTSAGGGIAPTPATILSTPQLCFGIDFDFAKKKCYFHTNSALCPTGTIAIPKQLVARASSVNMIFCPRNNNPGLFG